MPNLTQEAYEIRCVQLQYDFDQAKIKADQNYHKQVDKAWKTYKDKIARLRID
jgi:hypothetical protein